MSKIINIKDVYELKQRKQRELEFYLCEKQKLEEKLQDIYYELELTVKIINILENEN